MPKEMRRVEASILSNYVNEKVDFLKIDVEGAEREVLKELIDAGKLGFVEQMVIEYHHHIRGEVDAFSGMLKLLEDAQFGYHIEGHPGRPRLRGQIQDILIYTYKK